MSTSGLFDEARVPIEEKHVGRGRARQYPSDAVYWAALFSTMSRYGMSPEEMSRALDHLRDFPPYVDDAMAGRGDDVLIFMSDQATGDPLLTAQAYRTS